MIYDYIFVNNYYWYDFRFPYVTGTSVVALKYKDGILMAADMGGQLLIPSIFLLCLCLCSCSFTITSLVNIDYR